MKDNPISAQALALAWSRLAELLARGERSYVSDLGLGAIAEQAPGEVGVSGSIRLESKGHPAGLDRLAELKSVRNALAVGVALLDELLAAAPGREPGTSGPREIAEVLSELSRIAAEGALSAGSAAAGRSEAG